MQTSFVPTMAKSSIVRNGNEPVFNVYKTTDYSIFKIMADNRDVNQLHVQRLVASFREKHLISPIIVNERMQVIDGQHRLQASAETGLPVYYLVIPGYGINEVQILNTNQKNWNKSDFLEMYCANGVKVYLQFKEFMTHFPDFGIQGAERILTLKATGANKLQGSKPGQKMRMKDFEEGKLVIPNLDKSYIIARKIMDFKPFFSDFTRGTFISALLPLFASKNYNHKEMVHKLGSCPIKMTACTNVEAYRMLLEDIYNWKRLKENKVSFRYE